jgi:peroxiredoxin
MKTKKKNAYVAAVTGVLFLCTLFGCDLHTPPAYPVVKDSLPALESGNKATVYVFMTPDCPLCQGYAATLNALVDSFAGKNIKLIGIIPGDAYKPEEIRSFKTNYNLHFDVISDPGFVYTKRFDAKVTPEVFVTDSAGTVLYSGRVDDWMYETGKKRLQPTEHNLRDVLTAIANGEKRTFVNTQALGCIIERE